MTVNNAAANNAAAVNNMAAVIPFHGVDMFSYIRWYSLPGKINVLCTVYNGDKKSGMTSAFFTATLFRRRQIIHRRRIVHLERV